MSEVNKQSLRTKVLKTFPIKGMHCASCAITIDMDLEDLDGVQVVRTSYAKEELEVEFDTQKITEEKIIETVKTSGYTAKLLV